MQRSWSLLGLLSLALLACSSLSLGAGGKKKVPDKEAPVVSPKKGKSETIKLFNGKDLEGWTGAVKYFSVKDGTIVAKNTDPVKVSVYLVTERKFSDFRLTFEGKLVESEMHSGVAFWGRLAPEKGDPHTYQGHLVMFPRPWNIYDLHRRNRTLVPKEKDLGPKYGKQKEWNRIEILAQGNRIRVAVNGRQTIDWRDPQPDMIHEGPIGLQLHSNKVPQEVHFKGLVLETFPKEDRLITVKDSAK